MTLCVDGGLKVVEYTWVYPIYQAFFMVIYFSVSFLCAKPLIELWNRTKKYNLPSNRQALVPLPPAFSRP